MNACLSASVVVLAAIASLVSIVDCTSDSTASGSDSSSVPGPPPASLGAPTKHRESAATCPTTRPFEPLRDGGAIPSPFPGCTSDSQCTSGTNGRCDNVYNAESCACDYDQCVHDSDCSDAGVCDCRLDNGVDIEPNICLSPGNCRVDSDCGPGGFCSPSELPNDTCNDHNVAYYCHTSDDECVDDSQCEPLPPYPNGKQTIFPPCIYSTATGHWTCTTNPGGCDGGVFPRCGGS